MFLLRSVLVCLREGGHSVDMVPPMTFRQSDSSDSWDWSLELNRDQPQVWCGRITKICIAYQNHPKSIQYLQYSKWYHLLMLTVRTVSNDFNSIARRCEITLHLKRKFQIPSEVLQEYSSVLVVSPPSWIEPWMNPQISYQLVEKTKQVSQRAEAEHLEPQERSLNASNSQYTSVWPHPHDCVRLRVYPGWQGTPPLQALWASLWASSAPGDVSSCLVL